MKALVNLRYLNLEYVTSKNERLQLLRNFLKLQALKMQGCSNYSGEEEGRALYEDVEPSLVALFGKLESAEDYIR